MDGSRARVSVFFGLSGYETDAFSLSLSLFFFFFFFSFLLKDQLSTGRFKYGVYALGKVYKLCAPPRLLKVPQMLPLKYFQSSSDRLSPFEGRSSSYFSFT